MSWLAFKALPWKYIGIVLAILAVLAASNMQGRASVKSEWALAEQTRIANELSVRLEQKDIVHGLELQDAVKEAKEKTILEEREKFAREQLSEYKQIASDLRRNNRAINNSLKQAQEEALAGGINSGRDALVAGVRDDLNKILDGIRARRLAEGSVLDTSGTRLPSVAGPVILPTE